MQFLFTSVLYNRIREETQLRKVMNRKNLVQHIKHRIILYEFEFVFRFMDL